MQEQGLKGRKRGRWQLLFSNKGEPFNNVEGGLKKRHFKVYDQVQNSSQIRLKYHAKIGLKERLNTKGEEKTSNSKKSLIKHEEDLKI